MTARDLFLAQMHFRSAERCFHMETGYLSDVFVQWPMFREHGIRGNDAAYDLLGMDKLINFWGEVIWANTFMHPEYERRVISEKEHTVIRVSQYGALEEGFPTGELVGRLFSPSVATPDDWKRVKAERFRLDDPARIVDIGRYKERLKNTVDMPLGLYIGSLIGLTRIMLTFEGAIYACYDYPDMIEDMMETNCLLIEQFLDQVLPHFRVDIASLYENVTCKNGPTLPMWVFTELMAPRLKRISRKLRQHGVELLSVGSDGDVRSILPLLLDCGVNCLSPYEVAGCAHPGALLDEYLGVLRIIGGVDKLTIAMGKEDIDAYLHSIAPYVERGGYIPHIDHDVPASISQENYLYYLDRKRQMFG